MTWRLWLLPVVGTGASPADSRRPKYLRDDPQYAGVPFAALDYGRIPDMLVAADVTAAQVTSLSANPDATLFPANLDSQAGTNLATVQSALEVARLPAGWVVAATIYRDVARAIAGLMRFGGRFTALVAERIVDEHTAGLTPGTPAWRVGYDAAVAELASTNADELILSRANLDLTWAQLSASRQADILATVADRGLTLTVADATLVRALLRQLMDQWAGAPTSLGPLAL
jgi:hypothetical protein